MRNNLSATCDTTSDELHASPALTNYYHLTFAELRFDWTDLRPEKILQSIVCVRACVCWGSLCYILFSFALNVACELLHMQAGSNLKLGVNNVNRRSPCSLINLFLSEGLLVC